MDELQLIKQKINVVDLIQEYLPLKKAGINFKANCPFHTEKTPSFMVSPERGIWHCFGCSKGGDIFKFIIEKEGVEFKDALEILAKKAGVPLVGKKDTKNITDRLYEANLKAAQLYQYLLLKHRFGQKALEYLKIRGLSEDTIESFGLGYAPKNWEVMTKFLRKRLFTDQELITSGLCVPSRKGCYDRFRGRIIFPLIDVRGRIVGFSGRAINFDEVSSSELGPKYINTPQTPIFDKSKFLFGLHLSKSHIKSKTEAIITEGEIDMLMSYQSGVKHVTASKGTALTEGQIEILKKYTDTITLCFDTDLAGDSAARRGIEMADKAGMNIKVITIQGAKDPAELALKDIISWVKAVAQSTPIYDYYLTSASHRFDIKSASGKKDAFAELIPIWRKITDSMVKEHYVQKLASLLMVKEEIIRKEASKSPSLETFDKQIVSILETKKDDQLKPRDRRRLLEEYLIALLLHIPSDITYIPNFPETLLTEEILKQTFVLLVLYLDKISFKGTAFNINDFVKSCPEELSDRIDKLYLMELDEKLMPEKAWRKELDLVVNELKKMLIKSSLEKLSMEIKNAQSFEKAEVLNILNKRFRDLSLKLKNF